MSEFNDSTEKRYSATSVAERPDNSDQVLQNGPGESGSPASHQPVSSPAAKQQEDEFGSSKGSGGQSLPIEGMEPVEQYKPHFLSTVSRGVSEESAPAEEDMDETPADAHFGSTDESTEVWGAIIAAAAPILVDKGAKYAKGLLKGGGSSSARRVGRRVVRGARGAARFLESADVDTEPTQNASLLEVVIGEDDRVRIRNTTAAPWSGICQLNITARNGTRFVGTGWLIDERTLVTAGHCVFMHNAGGWASSIEVIAGRDGTEKPFRAITSTRFFAVSGWTKDKSRDHDYGAIILPSAFPSVNGARPHHFQFAPFNDDQLKKAVANISGYPADSPGTGKDSTAAWFHARRITSVTPTTIVYDIDTGGGQSGAPVWILEPRTARRMVCAIHTNGFSLGNSATRINDVIARNLNQWREEK